MNTDMPALPELRDIHLPADPGLWPPAPGWWIVAALLGLLLGWLAVRTWHYLELRRQRRRIDRLLAEIEPLSSADATRFLAQLSMLLRRLALMRFPRAQVAALSGDQWLRFLDDSGGDGQFLNGPGRLLAEAPYQPRAPEQFDTAALVSLVRRWIARNTGRRA